MINRYWRIDTPHQTLLLSSEANRLPQITYFGERLAMNENVESFAALTRIDITGGMLDAVPALAICPEASSPFPGQPGLIANRIDGTPLRPAFVFEAAEEKENHLSLRFTDEALGLTYTAEFRTTGVCDMIMASAHLESKQDIHLNWLAAPVFPVHATYNQMMDFSGRWCGEFQTSTESWSPGIRLRESVTGRTGHEHFPGLYCLSSATTNTRGPALAFHYGWSGGHRMIAEELQDGRRQVQFGHASNSYRKPARSFATQTLYATTGEHGLNSCATRFQRFIRDHLIDWSQISTKRLVHYNCWEAIYFDHKLDDLKAIASKAADLGAERFVLDDGWFKNRTDDRRALGDWDLDEKKYPDGLEPLIDHAHGLDLQFGIWFEPEMVNRDSDLFRKHPDWILGSAEQMEGRQQLVLDLSRDDVVAYIYDKIAAILSSNQIDYIKWDHNRVLPHNDAEQTNALYRLLDKLRKDFPHIEIESCASGGGRIDMGILGRTQRVWLSDSNDARERLKIQHNAALFLPAAITGSHVGPRLSHTSGRHHDISFRAYVAAQRHFGFEMDPRELTDEEATKLRQVSSWWKDNRSWMFEADILRLDCEDRAIIAEEQLSRDQSRFIAFVGIADTSDQISPRPLRLANLDPDACYKIDLINRDEISHLSRGDAAIASGPIIASGRFLMNHGVVLPWSFPNRVWVLEGHKLEA